MYFSSDNANRRRNPRTKAIFKKRRANSRGHRDCLIQENRLESLKNRGYLTVRKLAQSKSVRWYMNAYLHWSEIAVRMRRRHTHRWIHRWRRRRTVWGAGRTRVVLATSPAETDPRVANGIALHLVDGHFCCVTLDELNKSATLPRRNLDVGNLSKALEKGAELILSDIPRESSNEDCGVVWVGELIHWLRLAIVSDRRTSHIVHATHWCSSWATRTWHAHTSWPSTAGLVFRCCRGNAHGSVAAVNPLHFLQCALLVTLV